MTKACSVVSSSENQVYHILGLLLSISRKNENIRLIMKCCEFKTRFYERHTPSLTLCFDVLLTVRLGITLVINQLNAQNLVL